MAIDLTHYLTPMQAARLLGVRRQTVALMVKGGRLHATILTPYGRLFARGEVIRLKKLREQRQREHEQRRRRQPVA